jgi:hypothetical protein
VVDAGRLGPDDLGRIEDCRQTEARENRLHLAPLCVG